MSHSINPLHASGSYASIPSENPPKELQILIDFHKQIRPGRPTPEPEDFTFTLFQENPRLEGWLLRKFPWFHGGESNTFLCLLKTAKGELKPYILKEKVNPTRDSQEYKAEFHPEGITPKTIVLNDHQILQRLCLGGDLRHYCARRQAEENFTEKEIESLAIAILRQLARLHSEHQIFHNDIKPSNIFVQKPSCEKPFRPYLGDFGMASIYSEKDPFQPILGGTQGYLSPEAHDSREGTHHAPKIDSFSFGSLLVFLNTGKDPSRLLGKSPADYEQTIYTSIPQVLKAIDSDPKYLSVLRDLIPHLLESDPTKRLTPEQAYLLLQPKEMILAPEEMRKKSHTNSHLWKKGCELFFKHTGTPLFVKILEVYGLDMKTENYTKQLKKLKNTKDVQQFHQHLEKILTESLPPQLVAPIYSLLQWKPEQRFDLTTLE